MIPLHDLVSLLQPIPCLEEEQRRQALIVMDLHPLKTPATSASLLAFSRDLQLHHKNWQKWRNLHLHCFLELFITVCWDFHWLHHLYVYIHRGWGKAGVVKQTPPRHTYFMYRCNYLKVMLLLTACSLAPGDHTARLVFRLKRKAQDLKTAIEWELKNTHSKAESEHQLCEAVKRRYTNTALRATG